EAASRLKAKKEAGVSFLPPRQHSSSHCRLPTATLPKLKWDALPHPAYSPDLAPSDCHLFEPTKGFLGGKRFQNNGDIIAGVRRWIQEPPKTFSGTGINKFPESWHKCVAVNGATLKS
ncbi:hypothetical protein Cfor_08823, partial [Coptotermes formosanus]